MEAKIYEEQDEMRKSYATGMSMKMTAQLARTNTKFIKKEADFKAEVAFLKKKNEDVLLKLMVMGIEFRRLCPEKKQRMK